MLPLYSNAYFDFSADVLLNYDPGKASGWPGALLYASLGRVEAAPSDVSGGGSGNSSDNGSDGLTILN